MKCNCLGPYLLQNVTTDLNVKQFCQLLTYALTVKLYDTSNTKNTFANVCVLHYNIYSLVSLHSIKGLVFLMVRDCSL